MKEYEVNKNTIALLDMNNGNTKIVEDKRSFIINETPNKIMEHSCEYFGSSLSGRHKGTISLTGITHKSPIVVEEESLLIFFPTSSPRLKNCSWIATKNIENYYEENNKVIIKYNSGKKIELDISYGIIDNQILRSALLEKNVINRKKNQKKV